jgi:rhodanese-related sulfurtransferase
MGAGEPVREREEEAMVKNVTPTEAKRMIDDEGYEYLDVRSVEEYEEGHPAGAYNVPLLHAGMVANPEFAAVVERSFPTSAKLVVGCKSGGRSSRAAELLASRGYEHVVNVDGGFHGRYTPFGSLAQAGWVDEGLPAETESRDRDYDTLRGRDAS